MIHLFKKEDLLSSPPEHIVADEAKKVLIFRRKNCIFALNFNPSSSFSDYGFAAPAGKYKAVLDSDQAEFDGFSRLKTGETHLTVPQKSPNGNGKYDSTLFLYLPSRCAVVLEKVD